MIFKIQSFSDVITNSSSELFCTITSKNHIEEIFDVLYRLTGYNMDSEIGPCVYREDGNSISVHLPYNISDVSDLFRAGLEVVLNKRFKDDYEINY